MIKKWWTVVVVLLAIYGLFSIVITENEKLYPVGKPELVTIKAFAPNANEIHRIVNDYRTAKKLPKLIRDERLDETAMKKCVDMATSGNFSHTNSAGGKSWSYIKQAKISYNKAAENLAEGFYSAPSVVTAWEKSPEHNVNLLDPELNHVGYAACHDKGIIPGYYKYYVVQHFIGM